MVVDHAHWTGSRPEFVHTHLGNAWLRKNTFSNISACVADSLSSLRCLQSFQHIGLVLPQTMICGSSNPSIMLEVLVHASVEVIQIVGYLEAYIFPASSEAEDLSTWERRIC